MDNQIQDHELAWDDTIEKENSFIVLPEGEYDFTVTNMKRTRYTPGPNAKLPACNQAILDLTIHSPQGDVVIKHNLYLYTTTEGLLSDFFIGIGQKQKGQPLQMNWNKVVGATGKANIIVNKYTNGQGEERTNNQVKNFIDQRDQVQTQQAPMQQPVTPPANLQQSTQPAQNVTPFPTQQTNGTGFTPGSF